MKTTLIQLWNGELAPWSERSARHEEVSQLAKYIDRHGESLTSKLDEEGKVTLEKWKDCFDELERIGKEDAFLKGFSLGVRLVVEALGEG